MRGKRQWVGTGVVALLPWTWFAVRNLSLLLDLVATGLPVLCALGALGITIYAAVRKRRLLFFATVSWLLAGTVAVVGPWRPEAVPPPVRSFRIVSANVNSKNPTIDRAIADALTQDGDLVMLIEAGKGRWTAPPEYTTVIRPPYTSQGILSRFPAPLLDKPPDWPNGLPAHRPAGDAPPRPII